VTLVALVVAPPVLALVLVVWSWKRNQRQQRQLRSIARQQRTNADALEELRYRMEWRKELRERRR
jgi:hypothetical protein